jgi:hypothetical protein
MQARFPARLVALLCCAWSLGCASFPRPTQPFTDPLQALGQQQAARERVQSLRAEARVDQRGQGGRIKGTVLMFVQRPGRVRFDAMTQFGPAAILTSDGERFAYADLRNRRFLTGPTCPQNIARLLNLPLDVQQTTLLLLGGTPLIAYARASIRWNDDGFYRVTLVAADGARQEIDLGIAARDATAPPAKQALALARSEVYDAKGRSLWRIGYEDYRPTGFHGAQVAMPFLVRVQQPQADRDTLIRFKQITLDAEVPEGAFAQTASAGMEQEEASCE